MRAPQIVYSALITNNTTIAVTMLVDYTMPNEMPPETVELLIQPGEEARAERKLVEDGTVTWTGFICKVAIQGGRSMSEPFPGVFSPVNNYRIEIRSLLGSLFLIPRGDPDSRCCLM
ncbi:hypothetical protein BCY84_01094 [Trypanosoma cruzi cruzi]|nr:hypothetical protein BCY84_01094 [Trypanosoma cruzi cruzi]